MNSVGELMYGVPADLNLTFFHGSELIQVCLGAYQLQLHFHPEGSLSVEGDWELLGADSSLLDRHQPHPRALAFQLHRLLEQRVVASRVCPPHSIELCFERGEVLRVFDSSREYESFSIQPGHIVV